MIIKIIIISINLIRLIYAIFLMMMLL